MVLHINTTDSKSVTVSLLNGDKLLDRKSQKNKYGSQILLPLIYKLMVKNKLEFKDLKEIRVEKGPGSFTGIRVGVSVANTLAFSLGILVNGKDIETQLRYT